MGYNEKKGRKEASLDQERPDRRYPSEEHNLNLNISNKILGRACLPVILILYLVNFVEAIEP